MGRLDEILSLDVTHVEVLVSGLSDEAVGRLADLRSRVQLGERWQLEVEERGLAPLVQLVQASGGRVLSVHPCRQSLEEYFVERIAGGTEALAGWVQD
jgi:hypothetical protein